MKSLLTALIIGLVGTALWAGPIEDLKPGEWYEVPNSHASAVASSGQYGTFPNIMNAWCGGAFDTKRDRLIVHGGGHCDYSGNELIAFDLNTLQWSRLTQPTATSYFSSCNTFSGTTYGDGNPASRHTYDNLEYIPTLDVFFSVGGAKWGAGWGGTDAWFFDLNGSGGWTRKSDTPSSSNAMTTAYDPVHGFIYQNGRDALCRYNTATNTWTKLANGSFLRTQFDKIVGEFDPKAQKYIMTGMGNFDVYDVASNSLKMGASVSGGSSIVGGRSPGLAWDPVSEHIIGWGGGTSVYSLDFSGATPTWTENKTAGTNSVTPAAPGPQGTYGRFRYCPNKNVFVVVSTTSDNVFIYRLTPGTGTNVKAPAVNGSFKAVAQPNPFHSRVSVEWAGLQGPSDIAIYTLSGKRVKTARGLTGGRFDWDASGNAAGIYLMKITSQSRTHVARLFLQP